MFKRHTRIQWILVSLAILALFTSCTSTTTSVASPTSISGFRLNVSRMFGYSSGNQIKGSFRLSVIGVSDIRSVDYMIDGQVMARVDTEPYRLDFQTETYSGGVHTLSAIITTTDGRNVEVPGRQFEFATAQQEQRSIVGVIVPLGSVILLAVALGLGLQFLFMRNKKREFVPLGTPRNYGWRGGAICPKCNRPTVLHTFSFNLGINRKYDICENCGKWSAMKILPESELRKAEIEETKSTEKVHANPKTEEEKLKDFLDESKFVK
jgi:hypothetical protein